MKTSEKLERAGWVFQKYTSRTEHYERNGEIIAYDPLHDNVVSWKTKGRVIIPDAIQLELLFDKTF